jgi:hypothetical protein
LQYRGVAYQTTETGEVNSMGRVVRPAAHPQAHQAIAHAHARLIDQQELAKVHHQYLMERLQRRLEVARAKGDDTLVRQLEQEQHQLV